MSKDRVFLWGAPYLFNIICMKKYLLLSITAFLIACSGENAAIKEVAYNYCYALANYRLDDAEHYCTEETRCTFIETARFMVSLVDTAYIISDTPATVDILSVECVSDTTAIVEYRKVTPIKDNTYTLQMRKRDGRWLAHDPIKNNADAQ